MHEYEHMHVRRLLLYCARSFMRSLLAETSTRSIRTSAAELFYLRHLRSAASAPSGSQRSEQTSVTILVGMLLLFLTTTDIEKGCKYLAWAVMCHTFLRQWRAFVCYASFALIVFFMSMQFSLQRKETLSDVICVTSDLLYARM